jgi:transposase
MRRVGMCSPFVASSRLANVADETVEIAFVDQDYTGEQPADDAAAHGIRLEVIKLPDAKRGFVLLPRRWVVERSFGWVEVETCSS